MRDPDSPDDDLQFTLYRLQVVNSMPASSYKDSLLRALKGRLRFDQSATRGAEQAESRKAAG